MRYTSRSNVGKLEFFIDSGITHHTVFYPVSASPVELPYLDAPISLALATDDYEPIYAVLRQVSFPLEMYAPIYNHLDQWYVKPKSFGHARDRLIPKLIVELVQRVHAFNDELLGDTTTGTPDIDRLETLDLFQSYDLVVRADGVRVCIFPEPKPALFLEPKPVLHVTDTKRTHSTAISSAKESELAPIISRVASEETTGKLASALSRLARVKNCL